MNAYDRAQYRIELLHLRELDDRAPFPLRAELQRLKIRVLERLVRKVAADA